MAKSQAEKLAFIEEVCINTMHTQVENLCRKDLTKIERESNYAKLERWSKVYKRLFRPIPSGSEAALTALAVEKIKEQYQ